MTQRPFRPLLTAAVLSLVAAAASAQTDPAFVVERPSFSTPPHAVGRGFWQVEAGVGWETRTVDDDDVSTLTLPNSVVRLGVTSRLELRASTTGLVRTSAGGTGDSAASDVELGVKYQVASQAGRGLDLAIIPMVSLPTGGRGSTRNADPSAILSAQRGFGRSALLLNVKWTAPSTGEAADRRARILHYSASFSFPVAGRGSAFTEGVLTDTDTKGADTVRQANGGVSRLFGDNLELDVYGGVGLNDAAPDWRFGAGFAWRVRR